MKRKQECWNYGASPRMAAAGSWNLTFASGPPHDDWSRGMKVGIDLGTPNSPLAFIDPKEAAEADFPPIHVLPIEQQIDANRRGTLRTLPSFLYLSDPPV